MDTTSYVLITEDALQTFASQRSFQSPEFENGKMLAELLSGNTPEWNDPAIGLRKLPNGLVFFTKNIKKQKFLLYDFASFSGFVDEKGSTSNILTIFNSVLRCAIKYFGNFAYNNNERFLKEKNQILVYPYPFSRTLEVPKVVLDCNTSKEAKRKEYNILTAFSYEKSPGTGFNESSIKKAIVDIEGFTNITEYFDSLKEVRNPGYYVAELPEGEDSLHLDANIGFENWMTYLTSPQKDFVNRNLQGPERLQGAAGTGKTLTLCLRALHLLFNAEKNNEELHLIFFTHSGSSKEAIEKILEANAVNFSRFRETDEGQPKQSILVSTLQDWCKVHLGINDIQENEYLDKDVADSKLYQLMYIEEAWNKATEGERSMYDTVKDSLSAQFRSIIENTPPENIAEMLQMEISEVIKGQAKSDMETYLKITRPEYGMPLKNETDKRFVFYVFSNYQDHLEKENKFDSDDIVISSLGAVMAPIWTRRRKIEGYDACIIDETHLFNLNEISVFHYVNKPEYRNRIIFSIDKAQSIGDKYRADSLIAVDPENGQNLETSNRLATLFRTAPQISTLACAILTSGASLFRNLDNPMEEAVATLTPSEEKKQEFPSYRLCTDDGKMLEEAFDWAEKYVKNSGTSRNNVLLTTTNNELLTSLVKYAENHHKPYLQIKARADAKNFREEANRSRFVIGGIDYIGGLEFDAVAILGVDGERVPPKIYEESRHIVAYGWYNRLYVAVSRAKYSVKLFGDIASGTSSLLEPAIDAEVITLDKSE